MAAKYEPNTFNILDKWYETHQEYTAPNGQTLAEDFHIYGLIWNTTNIITYLDDENTIVLNVQINESFWEKGEKCHMLREDIWMTDK